MRCRTRVCLMLLSAVFFVTGPFLYAQAQPDAKKKDKGDKAPAQFGKKGKTPTITAAMNALTFVAPVNQLLANEEIVRDLKLDGKQQESVKKANAEYQEAINAAAGGGIADRLKKQQEATQKLNDALKNSIGDKAKRLDQIAAQGAGLPAYFTPARQQQLGLSDDQMQKGKLIVDAAYKEMQDKAAKDGTALTAVVLRNPQHRTTFIDNATPKLLELLSKDQNTRWLAIIGDPIQPELLLKVRTGSTAINFGFPGGGGGGGFNPQPGGGGFGGGKKGGGRDGGGFPPATAASRLAGSQSAFAAGNYAAAEDLARRALDLAKEPTVQRGDCLVALGAALCKLNRADDAETSLKDALAIYEKQVGPFNPRIAATSNWLGNCAERRGQHDKAEQLQRKALDIYEKVEGPNSAQAAHCWNNLGNIAVAQKKLDDAEKHHRKALEIREKTLAKNHPLIALSIHNLAIVYRENGKTKDAEQSGLRAVEMYRQTNPDHGDLVLPLRMLTDLCIQQKRWADAEKHARAWLRVLEADRGGDNVHLLADASLRRLDTNGDAKLNKDEMPARLKDNLAKWDKNKDALIDTTEYRDYFAAQLGDAVAPPRAGSVAMVDPLDRLATILMATDRRDEAAAVNQRKEGLKSKVAPVKKSATR